MESATALRCPGCGYENNPYYRYCGMCGSPLRAGEPPLPAVSLPSPPRRMPEPAPAMANPASMMQESAVKSAARTAVPITINGFSILGLSDDAASQEEAAPDVQDAVSEETYDSVPRFGSGSDLTSDISSSRNVQYLLEDDEPRSRTHWRMHLALALLGITAGALLWHWQTNGYPWEELRRERAARHAAAAAQPIADATVPDANAAAAPAMPSAGPGAAFEPPPDTASKTLASAPTPPTPLPAAPVTESAPSVVPAAQASDSTQPTVKAPIETQSVPKQGAESATPAKKPVARTAEPVSSPQSSSVAATDPAHLFAEGEKYLYGDGVPQDCDRAQKDLRTAAAHSDPAAESLLGTMYASGHCLGRDLPAAYRWYARALRHEPANTRISSDLQVLWEQMTPAERKIAQTGGQ